MFFPIKSMGLFHNFPVNVVPETNPGGESASHGEVSAVDELGRAARFTWQCFRLPVVPP